MWKFEAFSMLRGYGKTMTVPLSKIFIILIFSLTLSATIIFSGQISFFVFFALLTMVLFITRLKDMLLVFFIIRPVLDIFWDTGIKIGRSFLNLASIVSVTFVVASLCYIFSRKKNIFASPETLYYGIFIMIALISLILNLPLVQQDGIITFFRLLTTFFLIVIISQEFSTLKDIFRLFLALIVSLVIPVLYALIQIFTGVNTLTVGSFTRITGGFVDPNVFASYLGLFIIIIYCILMCKRLGISRWLILLGIEAALVLCMYLTYGRAALLGTFITISLLALSYAKTRKSMVFNLVTIAVILYLIEARSYVVYKILERFSDVRIWSESRVLFTTDNSLGWRVIYWKELLPLAFKSPIFGHGLDSIAKIGRFHTEAHNNYIQLFFETGIGVVFYFISIFYFLLRTIKGSQDRAGSYRYIYIAGTGVIVYYLIISMGGHLIRDLIFQTYFVSFLAMIIALDRLRKNMVKEDMGHEKNHYSY